MICNICGAKLSDDAMFCSECGQKITSEASTVHKQPDSSAVINTPNYDMASSYASTSNAISQTAYQTDQATYDSPQQQTQAMNNMPVTKDSCGVALVGFILGLVGIIAWICCR